MPIGKGIEIDLVGDISERIRQTNNMISQYQLDPNEVDMEKINAILYGQGAWQPKIFGYLSDIARKKKEAETLKTHQQGLGSQFGFLTDYIKGILEGGLPDREKYLQSAKASIGKSTSNAVKGLNENLASRGMFRSGVGTNALASIYGNEASALGDVENQLNQMELSYKQNAINNLLGLNQFEGNQYGKFLGMDRGYDQWKQGLVENQRQFNAQMDAQPDPWMQLLGSAVGGASQAGAAALIASDKKLKENIKKVGKTKSGLNIYEFNYKGDNTRVRGVMAQDVEKKIPKAVIRLVNYNELPPDTPFEVVEDRKVA
jgi:hypothetical protein